MSAMLLIDGVRFRLWTPKDEEKEFHPMIKEHFKEIFGQHSMYFDVRPVLRSGSGLGSIPDAYVIRLDDPAWYVVENELATHPVYEHIVSQLTKFINGLERQNVRSENLDKIYDKIQSDPILKAFAEKETGPQELYHFLSKVISSPPQIVVLIDKKTHKAMEAVQVLKNPARVVEFRTYVRENAPGVHAHLFQPIYRTKPPDGSKSKWDAELAAASEKIREIAKEIDGTILGIGTVSILTRRRKAYYKTPRSINTCFALLEITKDSLIVRLGVEPSNFKDPQNWSEGGVHKAFFDHESKFKITNKDQIAYAMSLVKQAYNSK